VAVVVVVLVVVVIVVVGFGVVVVGVVVVGVVVVGVVVVGVVVVGVVVVGVVVVGVFVVVSSSSESKVKYTLSMIAQFTSVELTGISSQISLISLIDGTFNGNLFQEVLLYNPICL